MHIFLCMHSMNWHVDRKYEQFMILHQNRGYNVINILIATRCSFVCVECSFRRISVLFLFSSGQFVDCFSDIINASCNTEGFMRKHFFFLLSFLSSFINVQIIKSLYTFIAPFWNILVSSSVQASAVTLWLDCPALVEPFFFSFFLLPALH